MNCHQGGNTRVLQPGKDYLDFRPGTPLYETAIFKLPVTIAQRAELDHSETLPRAGKPGHAALVEKLHYGNEPVFS